MELTKHQSKDGLSFYLNTQKSQGKPTVIMNHGNSMNAQFFHELASYLESYNVVCWDLPGHGDSDWIKPYSYKSISKLFVGAIEELKIDNFYMLGHSFGGHLAIQLAHEIKSKITGIIITGTPPMPKPPELEQMFLPVNNSQLAFSKKLNQDEAKELSKLISIHKNSQTEFATSILNCDGNFREQIFQSCMTGNYLDEIEILTKSKTKPLVIHGKNDPLISLEYLESKKNLFYQDQVFVIEEAGHSPHIEQPKIMARLITEYIENNCN